MRDPAVDGKGIGSRLIDEARRLRLRLRRSLRITLLAVAASASAPVALTALDFGLPVDCALGRECFVQQFPDMIEGDGVADPFCGQATYDGHSGTDFRLLSMADMARGKNVVAMADGTVLRVRDGLPDRLVRSEADRRAVAGAECGNGVVVDHGEGYQIQYCHLRRHSIPVKAGEHVRIGTALGQIGASGMAAFPHVHVTVRRHGRAVDPSTGLELGAGCAGPGVAGEPLFSSDAVRSIGRGEPQILALGVGDAPVEHDVLSESGPPPAATSRSEALVGWVWLTNLAPGDAVSLKLSRDAGPVVAEQSWTMDRGKASHVAFAGRRTAPEAGPYRLDVTVMRGSRTIASRRLLHAVE